MLELAHQGWFGGRGELEQDLLAMLGRGGTLVHGAAWALAWLSMDAPTDRAKRRADSKCVTGLLAGAVSMG